MFTLSPLQLAGRLALVLGLAVFLGLAFEETYKSEQRSIPGGIRSFPVLAMAGAMLYLIEPTHALAFVAGLPVLAVWLYAYMRAVPVSPDTTSMMIPSSSLLAYAIGPVALVQPPWVAVAVTVAAVLLLTRARAPAPPDPYGAARRIAHRRRIPGAGRYHPAAGAERGGDAADAAHALRRVAGGGRGLHAVLHQLSVAALSAQARHGADAGNPGRRLFLDRHHRGAGQAAARGRRARRHFRRHRGGDHRHVCAARHRHRHFRLAHRARAGAGAGRALLGRRRAGGLRMAPGRRPRP